MPNLPPSIKSTLPFNHAPALLTKYNTAPATSSSFPIRPAGIVFSSTPPLPSFAAGRFAMIPAAKSLSTNPSANTLHLILNGTKAVLIIFMRCVSAALEELYAKEEPERRLNDAMLDVDMIWLRIPVVGVGEEECVLPAERRLRKAMEV